MIESEHTRKFGVRESIGFHSWIPLRQRIKYRYLALRNLGQSKLYENIFTSIATSRINDLTNKVRVMWDTIEEVSHILSGQDFEQIDTEGLRELFLGASETYALDAKETIVFSSASLSQRKSGQKNTVEIPSHLINKYPDRKFQEHAHAFSADIQEVIKTKKPILFGPYVDETTAVLGKTISQFHDRITLTFMMPLENKGNDLVFCVRFPADVFWDIIQKPSSHYYIATGDNYGVVANSPYSFMPQGVFITRSRFEDDSFSAGENLKAGVRTRTNEVIKIDENDHTEFLIIGTDPRLVAKTSNTLMAYDTSKLDLLHPGIYRTIKNETNLEVNQPYADYRGLDVLGIGKIVTLQHSKVTMCMMFEGDFDEVWERQPITGIIKSYGLLSGLGAGFGAHYLPPLIDHLISIPSIVNTVMSTFIGAAIFAIPQHIYTKKIISRLVNLRKHLFDILNQVSTGSYAVDPEKESKDEIRELNKVVTNYLTYVNDTSQEIVKDIQRIGTDSSSLANGVVEQTQTLVNVLNNVTGLLEISQSNANTAEKAGEVTQNVSEMAKKSAEDLNATVTTMEDVVQSAQEVVKITDLVTNISEQTNLLSLNASIEAARAGEHGKGFSVVAQEVRKLAERSGDSSNQIRQLTSKSNAFIQKGNDQVLANRDILKSIVESMTESKTMVENIMTATHKQADELSTVAERLNNLGSLAKAHAFLAKSTTVLSNAINESAKKQLGK